MTVRPVATARYVNVGPRPRSVRNPVHRRGLQRAMQKLEQHQEEQVRVAQALHKADDSAPAVVSVSDDHPAGAMEIALPNAA